MKTFLFEKELLVVMADTDAGGRIYFGRPAYWFHGVFEEYLDQRGTPVSKILGGDFHLPIVNLEIQFKAPLLMGDRVRVAIDSIETGDKSFTVNYKVVDLVATEKVMITGKITHVCVDMKSGRARTLPEEIKEALI